MEKNNYVVIGGTSGIGRDVVSLLSNNGHNVIAGSRSAESTDFEAGVKSFTWDAVGGSFPVGVLPDSLQGLAYCPGSIKLAPLSRLTDTDLIEDFRVNVLGAICAVQACLSALKKSSTGASILLFSTVAVQTGMPFHVSVASAKGAIEGLTRALAAELAPRIRVNAIAPSLTETPLASQLLSTDTKRETSADRHPLKRVGTPGDISQMAFYLLDERSSWISGQILHVDGGMSSIRTFR